MANFKKPIDIKKSNIVKMPISRNNNKESSQSQIVNIERKINEKINDAIKKRLGSFVKEMQALKAKQMKLEALQKNKISMGIAKKNKTKNKKNKTKGTDKSTPSKKK